MKESEAEVKHEGVIYLLKSHPKTLRDEELLITNEQKSGLLRQNLLLVKML